MSTVLKPLLTLADLYPRGCILSGRPSPGAARWLRGTAALRDFLAGEPLSIAGDMPLVVGRGSTSPAGLELLTEAGHTLPPTLLPFSDAAAYLALLAELGRGSSRFALSHAHLPGELPEEAYSVPRLLLCELNNKRNLEALVPHGHRPAAVVLGRTGLGPDHAAFSGLPVVVKAAVDEPTGGGTAVRICNTPVEVNAALDELSSCAEVVVEELHRHTRSYNLQLGIKPSGEVRYLGVSEQIVTAAGGYRGNWLAPGLDPPDGALKLCLEIAHAAAARGYFGILGVDLAAGADGRVVVFDLNFRLNGSTPLLLLAGSVAAATGASVLRYRSFEGGTDHAAALRAARLAWRGGSFVPLNTFDPALSADPGARPWVSGIVLGADRDEVVRREQELRRAGLS